MRSPSDVVVVGSGPNGLAAAIVAARRGLSTIVLEARDTAGGGTRSAQLTAPGFIHDVCSSVHPMGASSPFFRALSLEKHGLEWVMPPAAAAHPLDDGTAVMLYNDLTRTADGLGADRASWVRRIGAFAALWADIEGDILAPIGLPSHPISFARFGLPGLRSAESYATSAFSGSRARALIAGCAAHSILPLSAAGTAGIGLAFATIAHARGWPIARGGSQRIADALASVVRSHGGEIVTGTEVRDFAELPAARNVFFDTSPRSMARIMGARFPSSYSAKLNRYPYGPGAFKVDWALSAPIPWKATACLDSATVHVGGTFDEVAASEAAPWRGEVSERPFVMVTQPSLFDRSRSPEGKHTAWGYCHVPNGSTADMTAAIEAQVERFAPGFRDVVIARAVTTPAEMERNNENLIGGDVGGGANTLANIIFRPTWRRYATPVSGAWLCSAATPPGAGVHGMCGYHAAVRALGGSR